MPAFDITEKRSRINIFKLGGAYVDLLSKNDKEIFDIGEAFQKLNRIREQKTKRLIIYVAIYTEELKTLEKVYKHANQS